MEDLFNSLKNLLIKGELRLYNIDKHYITTHNVFSVNDINRTRISLSVKSINNYRCAKYQHASREEIYHDFVKVLELISDERFRFDSCIGFEGQEYQKAYIYNKYNYEVDNLPLLNKRIDVTRYMIKFLYKKLEIIELMENETQDDINALTRSFELFPHLKELEDEIVKLKNKKSLIQSTILEVVNVDEFMEVMGFNKNYLVYP